MARRLSLMLCWERESAACSRNCSRMDSGDQHGFPHAKVLAVDVPSGMDSDRGVSKAR